MLQTEEPVKEPPLIASLSPSVAVIPSTIKEEEERVEEEQASAAPGPDGDDNNTEEEIAITAAPEASIVEAETAIASAEASTEDLEPVEEAQEVAIEPTSATPEPDTVVPESALVLPESVEGPQEVAFAPVAEENDDDYDDEEEYKGISSELDFDFLSVQELAELAEEAIIENGETLDDFDTSMEIVSVREDKIVDTTYTPPLLTKEPEVQPTAESPASSEVSADSGLAAATGAVTTGAGEAAAGTIGAAEVAAGTLAGTAATTTSTAAATTAFYDTTPESVETQTQPEVLNIADFIPDVRDALPDLFGDEPPTLTFEKEDPRTSKRPGHNSSGTSQTVSKTSSTVTASKTIASTIAATGTTSSTTSTSIKGELKIDEIPSFSDWVPELVESLKELDKSEGGVASTNTTVAPEAKTEVPEALEESQPETTVEVEPVETTPQNESLAEEHKKSSAPIYAGFAVLAAALTALVIAKRKKDKKDE